MENSRLTHIFLLRRLLSFWILFVAGLFVGCDFLLASPQKTQTVFAPDLLFVEVGGSRTETSPKRIDLQNGLFFDATFYRFWIDPLRQEPSNETEALAKWEMLRSFHSQTRIKIQSYGYLRSEMSVGKYISFGATFTKDRLVLEDVPSYLWIQNLYDPWGAYWLINFSRSLAPGSPVVLPTLDATSFLLARTKYKSFRWYVYGFTPELGLHLSNRWIDIYLRAGAADLSNANLNTKVEGYRATGNLGFRTRIFDMFTLHAEAYVVKWRLTRDQGPVFSSTFREYGGRMGIGLRLGHP